MSAPAASFTSRSRAPARIAGGAGGAVSARKRRRAAALQDREIEVRTQKPRVEVGCGSVVRHPAGHGRRAFCVPAPRESVGERGEVHGAVGLRPLARIVLSKEPDTAHRCGSRPGGEKTAEPAAIGRRQARELLFRQSTRESGE
jgi:hypothetical protein